MALEYSIRSGALPATAKVAGFRGAEGLSRPYVFDVYITVTGDHEIEPEDAVGSKATLVIEPGSVDIALLASGAPTQVTYGGVFASFEMVRALPGSALYLARLVPRLWQLQLTKHSRIFTKKAIPDVIEAVLEDEGITDYELRLAGAYETEEHICQYRESSLDFLHRWMEREGIYYFFEQSDDGEKLVIVDSLAKHENVAHGPVRYHPLSGSDGSAGRHFDNFTARAASLPAQVRLTDYDYTKPSLDVTGSSSVSPNGLGEIRDSSSGSRFFSPSAGARLASLRAEELRAEAAVHHATGAAIGLAPGYRFALEDHPRAALNKDYLVTRINHVGHVSDVARAWGKLIDLETTDIYRVDLTAISGDLQYRHPSRTVWPRIEGYESGLVCGPASSEYAQIDDHGRYLVKFKFDEGTLKDGKASTYVRMMQPHAGAIEGWHFPQRKGTEVVFLFLGGDPDRPVIAGAIPNATTPSPVTSGNHTKNVIQTGGRNRFELEDQAGQQRVTLSTPHANTYLRMGAANEDHELITKTDQRGLWCTGNNTDFTIGAKWEITVGGPLIEIVTGDVKETYLSAKTESVPSGLVLELYKAHMNIVATDSFRGVIGTTTDILIGTWDVVNLGATAHTFNTSYDLTVGGPIKIDTKAKTENTHGTADWTLDGKLTVKAPEIELNGSSSIKLEAPEIESNTTSFKGHINGPQYQIVYGIKTDINLAVVAEAYIVKGETGLRAGKAVVWEDITAVACKKMSATDIAIEGLENRTAGLERKMAGVQNQVTVLHAKNNALKTEMAGLRNNMAGLHNNS